MNPDTEPSPPAQTAFKSLAERIGTAMREAFENASDEEHGRLAGAVLEITGVLGY